MAGRLTQPSVLLREHLGTLEQRAPAFFGECWSESVATYIVWPSTNLDVFF